MGFLMFSGDIERELWHKIFELVFEEIPLEINIFKASIENTDTICGIISFEHIFGDWEYFDCYLTF